MPVTRIRKPQNKIKKNQIWLHEPTQGEYRILGLCKIKIPHVGWFWGVSYVCKKGKKYTRFIEDFENKFIKTNLKSFTHEKQKG